MTEPVGRRRKGGSKARRAAEEAWPAAAGAPDISRRIPPYEVLGEEALLTIEANADRILREIGVEFRGDEEALALWRQAGARVEGERVRMPAALARAILQTAPAEFTQHARNPARSVVIGGEHQVLAPAYGAPFVIDLDRGRRYATIEDFRNIVKLAYLSPHLHHSGGTVCEPVDVPVNKRHLDMVDAHIRYSDKPFMGSVTAPERAEDSVHMAGIVFGADFVADHAVLINLINGNSPLVFDTTMLGALKVYARHNQANIVAPFILQGAMSPVAIAGTLAQLLAEGLAGMAFTQLVRPGAPVVFGPLVASLSLQSGAPTAGTPESSLVVFAAGQLARRLGVPFRSGAAITTAKLADAEAGYESANSLFASSLAGVNFLLHAAGLMEAGLAISYEKFVMDLDQCGMLAVLNAGIDMSEEGQALDAVWEVGPGRHYLGSAHTRRNFTDAFYRSPLASSDTFEQWKAEGGLDMAQRANRVWKAMLEAYEAPPLDPAVSEALSTFVAERKASMPDAFI